MAELMTGKQWGFCIGYGIALWLGGMMLIRTMGPIGALSGWGLVISFLVLIPGTLPAVLLTRQMMGNSRENLLVGVSVISILALLLGGICISFWPSLYGDDPKQVLAAAGFLLWGGGLGFALAFVVKTEA